MPAARYRTILSSESSLLLGILLASLTLYLTYIPLEFVTDDWVWLAAAKDSASNARAFVERPVLGYFRPFTLLYFLVVSQLSALDARVFGMVSVLLHLTNVFLVWKVLYELNTDRLLRLVAVTIFSTHLLVFPTVGWISEVCDLWVTTFGLVFLMTAIRFARTATPRRFVFLLLLWFCATLFKESGLVLGPLLLLVMSLSGKSVVAREYVGYTAAIILCIVVYVAVYFGTRRLIDRPMAIGIGTIANFWFLVVYQFFPISKQLSTFVPVTMMPIAGWVKIVLTALVPVALLQLWRHGQFTVRMFLCWLLAFIGVIALFDWRFNPFSLYPEQSISRFFYASTLGLSVCLAWAVHTMMSRIAPGDIRRFLPVTGCVCYLAMSYVAVGQSVRPYRASQELTVHLREDLAQVVLQQGVFDTLQIITESKARTPQFIYWPNQLASMLFVLRDRRIVVQVDERQGQPQMPEHMGRTVTAWWNIDTERLFTASSPGIQTQPE